MTDGTIRKQPPIPTPKDSYTSLSVERKTAGTDGKMTGAQAFAALCQKEDLAAMFCVAGNYTVINAIAEAGIPSYGGRTEGAMALAADGFSRATGEVVACSGSEGPGFTHMIQAIYAAHAANTPLLVLASNMTLAQDDSHAFIQDLPQQPLTTGIKKYGKRIIQPDRLFEYSAYAFRALKTGVPGPVHLDFPGEVSQGIVPDADTLLASYDTSRNRTESRPTPATSEVRRAVEMIERAERPLLIAGHGVFHRKAWEPLLAAAEIGEIPVATSGPMRGHFPDDHKLSACLSNDVLIKADLVIFVGQYLMPTQRDFLLNPEAEVIRVHPDPEDIGRNWPVDLGVVSDELAFLQELAGSLPRRRREAWVDEIAAARQRSLQTLDTWYANGLSCSKSHERVHPIVMGREIHDFFYAGKIDPKQTVSTWGGLTTLAYVPPYLRANRPGQNIVSLYQAGTLGAELGHGIGAAAAVKQGVGVQAAYKGAPVIATCSDGGLPFAFFELDTAAKYKLPLIVIVYNNDCWGTFRSTDGSPSALHIHLFQENLRYDQMAEGLGVHGEYVRTVEEFREALARCYEIASRESLPSLINVQGMKEYSTASRELPGILLPKQPGIGAISH